MGGGSSSTSSQVSGVDTHLSSGQAQIHTHLDEIDVAVADVSDKTIQELQGTLTGNPRCVMMDISAVTPQGC